MQQQESSSETVTVYSTNDRRALDSIRVLLESQGIEVVLKNEHLASSHRLHGLPYGQTVCELQVNANQVEAAKDVLRQLSATTPPVTGTTRLIFMGLFIAIGLLTVYALIKLLR